MLRRCSCFFALVMLGCAGGAASLDAGLTPVHVEDAGPTLVTGCRWPLDAGVAEGEVALDAWAASKGLVASRAGCATTRWLYLYGDRRMTLPDVSGDGRAEEVQLFDGQLSFGTGCVDLDASLAGYIAEVGVADVNDDGAPDLLVGHRWDQRLSVFFGPLRARRSTSDADLIFTQPGGGLSTFFGAGVVVLDANGDGHTDVVLPSASEQEEACSGQRPPRVFFGPFTRAAYDTEDAGVELDVRPMQCIGEHGWCSPSGFALSARQGGAWACEGFAVPLDGGPTSCD